MARNVLGGPLETCSLDPMTGFFRDGCCRSGAGDVGVHAICVELTEEFLAYSVQQGNDLVTPRPELGFAGLVPGQRWCVCASRWQEALKNGVAPPVILDATSISALEWVTLSDLREHSTDALR